MEQVYHTPVLLHESIEGLNIKPNGVYVDVTFGGGGHAKEILKHLTTGKLIAFDQDGEAAKNVPQDERLIFVPQNFRFVKNWIQLHGYQQVDGILADLGVSSHQFDSGERGFSIRFNGPLDMRMNQHAELNASKVVNTYPVEDLIRILRVYGEVDRPHVAAHKMVNARPIRTTHELIHVLIGDEDWKFHHQYLAQVFQALRIEVNQEMEVLETFLSQLKDYVEVGGRVVVISYHSLEDRMVKSFFRSGNVEDQLEKDFFGNIIRPFKPLNAKPILPSAEEINDNSRARSAKMRIAEKLA
jgi:16S rRNA (cytosine1402-N4)-methyltransferase